MIIKTPPVRPRYSSRAPALPLLLLLAGAFATRANAPHQAPSPYLQYFLHHLRYPQDALDAGLQGTVWFSIHVDEQGQMTRLTPYPSATEVNEHKGQSIRVVSLSAPAADRTTQQPSDKNAFFLEEVQKVTESIGKDKSRPYPAGDYYFSVSFSIEKP